MSGEQLPAVNTWVKLMEINCKYVQWLQLPGGRRIPEADQGRAAPGPEQLSAA